MAESNRTPLINSRRLAAAVTQGFYNSGHAEQMGWEGWSARLGGIARSAEEAFIALGRALGNPSEKAATCMQQMAEILSDLKEVHSALHERLCLRPLMLLENPGRSAWDDEVLAVRETAPQIDVESLTNPDDYPDYFYLGLLKVPQRP